MRIDVPPVLHPVFERHGVEERHRTFLYRACDRLIEENFEFVTSAEAVTQGYLGADSYEELLQQHNRGHRQNTKWLRAAALTNAVPTRLGRALLRDLVAVNPEWADPPLATGVVS